jgi:DNA-binding transcriptional MerR regulator
VQARVDDLDLWRAVLKWWRLNGYTARSIGRMLDKYRQTDSPEDLYGHSGDGRSGSSSGTEQVPIFDDPNRSTIVW